MSEATVGMTGAEVVVVAAAAAADVLMRLI